MVRPDHLELAGGFMLCDGDGLFVAPGDDCNFEERFDDVGASDNKPCTWQVLSNVCSLAGRVGSQVVFERHRGGAILPACGRGDDTYQDVATWHGRGTEDRVATHLLFNLHVVGELKEPAIVVRLVVLAHIVDD